MSDTPKNVLEKLHTELLKAADDYDDKRLAASEASNRETDALNKLNGIQKKYDEAILALKKEMPSRSDWAREAARNAR